jgi:predicted ATP-grasp superfamily ATP-dependent carboligase
VADAARASHRSRHLPDAHAKNVRVIVTGGQHPAALAALRSLWRAGFTPTAVTTKRASYAAYSRASDQVVRVPAVAESASRFVRAVAELCTSGRTVVIPGTEPELVALAAHQHLLPEHVLGLPSLTTVERVTDKTHLNEAAAAAGFAVPATTIVTEANAIDSAISFPTIAKPVQSSLRHDDSLTSVPAISVADAHELEYFVRQLRGRPAIVQPHIQGQLHSLAGVMWKDRLHSPMQQVALSIFPRPCGGSAVARTERVDESILARAERMLRELQWEGIVQLQWIDDGNSEYVIDLNPRIYGSLALANAAGANLAVTWTRLLIGDSTEDLMEPRDVLYRNLETFARAGGRAAFRPPRTLHGSVNSVFSVDDPLPVVASAVRGARKFVRKLKQSSRKGFGRLSRATAADAG